MLVSERTALATKPVGTLVTLDKIFELVEGNLSSEKQKDISDIRLRFAPPSRVSGPSSVATDNRQPTTDNLPTWEERVAKTICLLEFVRDLPRTEANITACLIDDVGKPPPLVGVQKA